VRFRIVVNDHTEYEDDQSNQCAEHDDHTHADAPSRQ